ncbi:MAG TPA: UDP-N-acetylglucosamine 2-epimerase (non-hydrolyzing) [Leptospiraceae bacterium]|nr:UDP-N-acetylglucosamine 2-epimerase (non-hydrolyzing) [Leptospiraceae bacterium]HMW04657.1 UDP-N-acetylglucosamine 2-epimerase (non-hydrolyzing) [Leptospiraceae bacterium]HMX31621.1 UDP-N-acetylglucosamine 2-epimerase (non-hydrolyzing) [Leptospiraceae bacterium]HMY30494.1 UDP-N-acetylglucosamine 2-epimerase (non-hydrolyzing) [Leptospiraceae bacterium]HMZ65571.1 UDP-N-acetylglucosamine 2-epimerase (non-hydrolyzing) [Leptospiraceae bacterium]
MKKILTIVGARPQFVKAAAVSREFKKHKDIQEVIVHTGQHFDKNMSDIFFEEMEIPKPDYNLNINGLGHGAMTGQMMEKIEEVILKEKPDFLMVYGDTNSTLAGALAAKKIHVRVIHIEAGLRSFNMNMPEEINRILTDRISDILFCPTEVSIENLKREGFENFKVQIVKNGDVMQDAAIYYSKISSTKSRIIETLGLKDQKFILSTIHRAENTDDLEKLKSILSALNQINKEITIVCPLHPRTHNIIKKNNLSTEIKIIEPVGYFDMIELLKNSVLVMTDSGGVQKEAFFFEKPCITMREETEWLELVESGYNVLVGSDSKKIIESVESMKSKKLDFSKDLYGKGKSCSIIAETILNYKN